MSEVTELLIKMIRSYARSAHSVPVIAKKLLDQDRALVDDWLKERTYSVLTQIIRDVLRGDRMSERFRADLEDSESEVSIYDLSHVVSQEFERKPLGDMTRDDLMFVATAYERSAQRDRFFAEIYRQMAAKVGRRKVRDVFTEDQLHGLFQTHSEGPQTEVAS